MTVNSTLPVRPGLELFYDCWGSSAGASPVIFIHGWAGSSQDWQTLLPQLAPTYPGLVYDAAGFGKSQFTTPQTDYSLDRYVDDLKILLDQLGYERVRLVGHSWGGVVGMAFAARYPAQVENLCAIGTAYFDPDNPLHQIFKWVSYLIGWLVVLLKKPLSRSARLRRWSVRRYFKQQPDPATLEKLMQEVLQSDNQAIIKTLLTGYEVKFKAICPAIQCPTLYLGCRQDLIAPLAYVKAFVPLTPQARYYLIEECGHFPMLEKPAELAALLTEFWNDSPPLPD